MIQEKTFATWKVLLPVTLGLAVVGAMLWHDASKENLSETFANMTFDTGTILFLLLAMLFTAGRIFGFSWRFRILTDKSLSWRKSVKVELLCEFTSCITPSAVGGSSLGMVFLNSEGVEFGKATTLMLTTLILDESFFVVICPIVVALTPGHELFANGDGFFTDSIRVTFWLIYAGITAWTLVLFAGTIWRPGWMRVVLGKVFSLRWLRRWETNAMELGNNMVAASGELRRKSATFWVNAFGATAVSWISRFLVVNAIFMAFLPSTDLMQPVIFARQVVIWVILMVCPTPGGAGLSEWLFSEYYGDIVCTAGIALVMAVIWRILSYYLFLFTGAIIVPAWIRNSYHKIKGK